MSEGLTDIQEAAFMELEICRKLLASKDARIQYLLEANNRYLERARGAEARIKELEVISSILRKEAVSIYMFRDDCKRKIQILRDTLEFIASCDGAKMDKEGFAMAEMALDAVPKESL